MERSKDAYAGRFSAKSKGGAIASRIDHQDAVASVLALEAISGSLDDVPSDILEQEGFVACEWDQDLEIHWPEGVLWVQVKDQTLQASSICDIAADFEAIRGGPRRNAYQDRAEYFRIECLAGLDTSGRSLADDIAHLRVAAEVSGDASREILLTEFRERWGDMPLEVAERLTIVSRDLRMDSMAGFAAFAHILRSAYPISDYSDRRIGSIWGKLAGDTFASARRKRAPVLLSFVDSQILQPLLPNHFQQYEDMYVRTPYGYVVDPEKRERVEREERFVNTVMRRIRAQWRRKAWSQFLKDTFLNFGPVRCPACNGSIYIHPLGNRGAACGECGYSPFATVVYLCDCESLVPIVEQPELDGPALFSEAIYKLRQNVVTCSQCGAIPRVEMLAARLVLVPFRLPVSDFSSQDLISIRIRLGWKGGVWPDEDQTPLEKMLAEGKRAAEEESS